ISLQKFQQKALKQTKQKKSKSAEFLMVKEERAATEGIENPAFNISSTDLSAYQTSEEKVIRHDKLDDSTLAAHQQKPRLQAHAEPRGNEYSRNYFDPLMDEEINPRQCGMEVSEEGEAELSIFSKTRDLHREVEDEVIPSYIKQFERDVQDDIILLGSFSLEQVRVKNCKTILSFASEHDAALLTLYTPILFHCPVIHLLKGEKITHFIGLLYVDGSETPQPIEIHIKCLRGVKDKVPKGHYSLKVSVLSRLGGGLLQWPRLKEQPWARTTLPVSHDGNFYNTEIYFGQSIQTVLPPKKAMNPGMVLLFELFLLRGTWACIDREVGWGAFPLCDNNFNALEGKFKCPFLRGHYNSKVDRFKKIENFISLDLDHWLCNLYFQINWNNPPEQYYREKTGPVNNASTEKGEASSQNNFYLEELEKYTFSVCCHSAVEVRLSKRIIEHFHFGIYAVFSELGTTHWHSWDFWLVVLLVVLLWFVRLYLHYCSQWLFLQTISIPVTKFQFFPHTVELCYQNSLLQTTEELAMVVVGPLTLNAGLLLLVLIRWGCQQLFDSFPSFLSKFIMAMGLWTVLDPLAVFVVDSFLGRLANSVEKPIADAAKLYWVFLRAEESGIPGALITVMLYTILFIISSTVLYLYFLRYVSLSCWLLDVFRRIHGEEATFFVPLDLEISSQELSYIMKKAEQWRGINGERRMVSGRVSQKSITQPQSHLCSSLECTVGREPPKPRQNTETHLIILEEVICNKFNEASSKEVKIPPTEGDRNIFSKTFYRGGHMLSICQILESEISGPSEKKEYIKSSLITTG
uniref:Orofacial cleft 1 candidate gene 1 protein n=1 Tax=Apteryx owenii TaxID=8824 RepID=A0A8B9QBT3_APTOW